MSKLIINKKEYSSRLILGTGKYKDFDETKSAVESSGCQIVTVAVRRMNIGQDHNCKNLLDYVSPDKYTILPNTAGCYTAEDAVRTCELAEELLNGEKLIKLEVLSQNIFYLLCCFLRVCKGAVFCNLCVVFESYV